MLKIILFGLIVHAFFLASIFQIYFQSPVISGLQAQPNFNDSPARRLTFRNETRNNIQTIDLYFIVMNPFQAGTFRG